MTLPHEIEVGEIVGLRHWKPITGKKIATPLHECVAYAINPNELTKITECDYKIVREIKLTSGLIGDGVIWPTNGRVEAKCIRESPAIDFKVSVPLRSSQLKEAWCARRGYGPAPCTMDRPFVCNDGYSGSQCGIYAWNVQGVNTRGIRLQIEDAVRMSRPGLVWGLVALSGRVVEHEEGYRAEFARPIAILIQPHSGRTGLEIKDLLHLTDLYKVERYTNIEALLLGLHLYERERKKKGKK